VILVDSNAARNSNVIARKLATLQKKGAIRSVDVANVLEISPETVSRWNRGKAFPQPDAEKMLLDLEYVVEQLADFYSPDEARLWLLSRQKMLNGQSPVSLIQQHRTDTVLKVIKELLEGVHV
jgi:transcriptional regulator with XRE-family HTH domain